MDDPTLPYPAGLPSYEVYALKYGHRPARRSEHFVGGDPHDEPMDMDYFVWAIVDPGRVDVDGADPHGAGPGSPRAWVVDTGFEEADGTRRRRTTVRSVTDALGTIGVAAADVADVVITHLHYDHIGGHAEFPRASFHLQDAEMAFATGRYMTHKLFSHAFTVGQIQDLVGLVFDQRVTFHDGAGELAPGISLQHVGGHTMGLQVVRVHTAAGWLVLASDAAHYYEHLDRGRAFTTVFNVGDMLEGHRRCRAMASAPWMVIPGHDPRVLERHPAAGPGLDGIAARVDLPPVA